MDGHVIRNTFYCDSLSCMGMLQTIGQVGKTWRWGLFLKYYVRDRNMPQLLQFTNIWWSKCQILTQGTTQCISNQIHVFLKDYGCFAAEGGCEF